MHKMYLKTKMVNNKGQISPRHFAKTCSFAFSQ